MSKRLSRPDAESKSPVAWRMLALPLAGASLLVAVIGNEIGTGWIMNPTLHELAATTIGLGLLLRIVAKECADVLKPTMSWLMVATSVASFSYAAWIMHYLEWTEWNTERALVLATIGSAAGMLAYLRTLKVLRWCAAHPMPVCLAVVIGLCPTIFYSFHMILWQWTGGTIVAMVKTLLRLCGIALTEEFKTQRTLLDVQDEFIDTIHSADFGISISWECSGLEGELLFCLFISVFLLYDWQLFRRMRGLGLVYLLVPALVLVVNAVRIASIFLYGEWALTHKDAFVSARITTDAFHSNAGLVLYTAVFAMILPLLYRWARRQTDVRQPFQDGDGPASR